MLPKIKMIEYATFEEDETSVQFETIFESSVTAPFCANNFPSTLALVERDILEYAFITPLKSELEPIVTEVPTFQNILHAVLDPLTNFMDELPPVFKLDAI